MLDLISPRDRNEVEELLRSTRPVGGGCVAVELEPLELRGVAPSLPGEDVFARVVTPREARAGIAEAKTVDLWRSGQHVIVDVYVYRELDQWESPISPEMYERLLEHVATLREDVIDGGSVGLATPDGRARLLLMLRLSLPRRRRTVRSRGSDDGSRSRFWLRIRLQKVA